MPAMPRARALSDEDVMGFACAVESLLLLESETPEASVSQ